MPLDALSAPAPAYASLAYARTLSHAGQPWFVPEWGTHVLLRPVPGAAGRVDAMGPYPLCTLAPDADIPAGLGALRDAGAVSIVLVADPLAGPRAATLARDFPICRPFKTHWLIDRDVGAPTPSKHHRDRIRRGQRHATARRVSLQDPAWQARWGQLYAGLAARRGITGVQDFPPAAFAALARLDGDQLVAIAAEGNGDVLAMQLWMRHGDRAYSHLTATSETGRRLGATYVAYAAAVEELAGSRVLNLGGGSGDSDDLHDTLAAFKRGFANASAPAHLCAAVLDAVAYANLAAGTDGSYFPAYRQARS